MTANTETLTQALYSGTYVVVNSELTQLYGKEASYLVGYLSGLMRIFNSDSVYQSYTNFDTYADLKRRELNTAIEILEKAELLQTKYQSVPSGHRSFDGAKVRVFYLNTTKIVSVIRQQQMQNKQKNEENHIKNAKKDKAKRETAPRKAAWFYLVDTYLRKNKLGIFANTTSAKVRTADVFEDFSTVSEEKTNNTFDFICKLQYDIEKQVGSKVFSTPKVPTAKRVKHVEAQLKLLCCGKFFEANNWDSEWIKKAKLDKDSLFGTGIHSIDKIRERLIRAAVGYFTAKKDTSCVFFGNRSEMISLSEFIYDEGQSLFWYWFTYEPTKLVDLSWTEPYLKNIPEDMLKDCFIKERNTWKQHLLAVARMVRWIKQEIKAQRFLVRQGKLSNKLCMTWIKGWFEDTCPYTIPYPDWDRPVFKSFINWMREVYDAEIKRDKPKAIAGS